MKLKTILIDVDGCLVDARCALDETGNKVHKYFHARDSVAIRKLVEKEYRVIVISNSSWKGVKHWCKKHGCEYMHVQNKADIDIDWSTTLSVGDDYWLDKDMLDKSYEACVPADADIRLLEGEDYLTLITKGGDGIVNEMMLAFDL